MAKPLIIVESPTKARTIKKFLPARFVVKASVGHVRDLPKSTLGVNVEDGSFTPKYLTIKGKGDIIKELKAAAKNASDVYLATDPDREGEAIAWHLAEILKLDHPKRIELHEITKDAALAAIKDPHEIDMPRVNAQQARRILDRLVGYKISPLLWAKVRGGLSAGRVQSVAVRLIVDREREIAAFIPREYWSITAQLASHGSPIVFPAELNTDRRPQSRGDERGPSARYRRCRDRRIVRGCVDQGARAAPQSRRTVHHLDPPARSVAQAQVPRPQNHAAGPGVLRRRRSWGQRRHARSHHLHADRLDAHRGFGQRCGSRVHRRRVRRGILRWFARPKLREGAQDAHEAIRPTFVHRHPDTLTAILKRDELRLYKLIWERFVASQMAAAIYDQTTVDLRVVSADGSAETGRYTFRASGSVLKFAGFTAVYEEGQDDIAPLAPVANGKAPKARPVLPKLTQDEKLETKAIEPKQHFTEPPPRYSEASLVKALEENRIGRPSTYSAIVETIQARGYVEQIDRRFHPTDIGFAVNDLLAEHFKDIVDPHSPRSWRRSSIALPRTAATG